MAANYRMPDQNEDGTYKITTDWYQNFYLKSNEWKEISSYVKQSAGGKCAVCGSKTKINVHHKSYEALKRSGKDDDAGNLVTVCEKCHADIHTYGQSLQGIAYTAGVAFVDKAVNNTILGNAQAASSGALRAAETTMRTQAMVAITDAYVFSRAKEFSENGDFYMLSHGNPGGVNKYLGALLSWDPSNRAAEAWEKITGGSSGMCGIGYGRYVGLYKAIASRNQEPWQEIKWRNKNES